MSKTFKDSKNDYEMSQIFRRDEKRKQRQKKEKRDYKLLIKKQENED